MKKILLIYPYYNQNILISNFLSRLYNQGIQIDCLCIANLAYVKHTNTKWPTWINLILRLLDFTRGSFAGRCLYAVVSRFCKKRIIGTIIREYDLIDFHAYTLYYNPIMKICVKKNIPFDITNWGSDVMRTTADVLKKQEYGYSHSRFIKSIDSLQLALQILIGHKYDDKFRTVYFGNSDFPVIDRLTDKTITSIKKTVFGVPENKRIIVCGYNGSKAQNHIDIIEALKNVPSSLLESYHILLPMTYGADSQYLNAIETAHKTLPTTFTILKNYLSVEENAALRKSADIVVNIQTTDALAGSLQDHLYCGNVCIFGEWLNYIPYDKNNVFYIKSSKANLAENITNVIEHYNNYKEMAKDNPYKMRKLFSWENVIKKWCETYGE